MKKKIIIAGATGMIGRKLCAALYSEGFEITAFSHAPKEHAKLFFFAENLIEFTPHNKPEWSEFLNSSEAAINLSGAPLAAKRWTAGYKRIIYDSRIDTTRMLADAILESAEPPRVFINASAIGYYGFAKESRLDENSPHGSDFIGKLCSDWESAAMKASQKTRVVLARLGMILDKREGALPKFIAPFRNNIGGKIGSGLQWLSWIHIDDAISLFLRAIVSEKLSGGLNFVSPNPVRMNDFAKTLGYMLKKPSFFTVPGFLLKLLMGELSSMILEGQRVVPQKVLEDGYKFRYERLDDAFRNLLGSGKRH